MQASKPEQKNILVLVEHAGQGGAEKVAATLAETLAAQEGYRVHYCSLYQPAKFPEIPGVEVASLGLASGGGMQGRLQRYWGAVARLRRFKKANNIHLTISNLWPTDWVNFLTGREKKVAVIHTTILHSHHNQLMVKARKLVSFIYGGLDKVVLVSDNQKPELADFFKVPTPKLQVIYNPVDNKKAAHLAEKAPSQQLEKLLSERPVLTTIGRLSPGKNVEALIRIYQHLRPTNARLLIVGEGPEKPTLETVIQAVGLTFADFSGDLQRAGDADIYFAPYQQNVFAVLRRSTLFLFPTRGEGLPLVLLESMSCGCPALASDCPNGGVSEIMQGKTHFDIKHPRTQSEKATGGYLMPIPDDAATDALWAEKIQELLSLDDAGRQALRHTAQKRAADFDISHFSRQWQELVQNLLHETK